MNHIATKQGETYFKPQQLGRECDVYLSARGKVSNDLMSRNPGSGVKTDGRNRLQTVSTWRQERNSSNVFVAETKPNCVLCKGQIEGSVEAHSQSQFVATGFEKGRLKRKCVFEYCTRAFVKNKYSQWVEVRCLLDVGSQSCLCTRACAEKLQLKMEKINTVVSCVNDTSMVVKNCVKTSVANRAKTFESELMLLVVNKITDLIPNKVIDVDVNVSEFVPLADDKFNIPDRIDMLLGAEIFYELLKPGKFYCDNSHLVLQNTVFGYGVSGSEVKEDVFETISRLRRHKFAFTTDIQKMYSQILINPDQQDLQRIIWKHGPDAEILTYRLKTVTYGLSNATFLAIRTLQQLAKDEKSRFPLASETLLYDTYMDDIVSGAPDLETAQQLQSQLKDALQSCGMNLHKWSSNSPELLNSSLSSDVEHSFSTDIDLSVKTLGISWKPFEDCFVFKQLWQCKLDWDDVLPNSIANEWREFVTTLKCIEEVKINRFIMADNNVRIVLQGFADASEAAYGAVVLPTVFFTTVLPKLNISDIVLHTDSTIALAWLNTPADRLKTFVANRVAKVQELTEGFQWNHVPSVLNPADLVSRRLRPCDLPNLRLWWHGPQLLEKGKLSSEETSLSPVKECEYSKELKTGSSSDIITSSVCVSTNCVPSILSTLLRKNSDGLLRVGGQLSNSDLPYVNKHPAILPGNHNLTVQIIVHFHRKNLHTGASSLLHYVREKFWPLNGRSLCRKVVHECLVCFKSRPLVTSQLMGNLPRDRVVPDYPFNCSGANKELKRFLKLIEDSDDNLAGFLSAEGIEWKFIPPRVPSFGGLWEASVKSKKYHLRRVVSGSNLIYEEFLTVCIQIEEF
ncbi:integrase catalytic domain-containing protein [Trichonephila clavipes]|nr:integrase catalytic domain-containing protein [Trichonephila clavipes]